MDKGNDINRHQWGQQNKIEMQLNTANNKLRYNVNDVNYGYVHDGNNVISLSLKGLKNGMAVCIYGSSVKVKLIDFVQVPIDTN